MKKIIFFDLDGVLIHSINNMKYAWKNSCSVMSINIPFSKYKKNIGLPFFEILKKLKIKKKYHLKLQKNYNYYSSQKINSVKITKENLAILKELKKKYILVLFTSKNKSRAQKVLGINKKLFKYKVFPSKKIRGKPYPDGINQTVRLSKIKKKYAIYLGDSLFDYRCAKNANVDYIHAGWGYQKIKKNNLITIKKLQEIKKYL